MARPKTEESKQLDEKIVYYYTNGWKFKDIANELGLTVAAVDNRLCKIRKKQEVKRWWQ